MQGKGTYIFENGGSVISINSLLDHCTANQPFIIAYNNFVIVIRFIIKSYVSDNTIRIVKWPKLVPDGLPLS